VNTNTARLNRAVALLRRCLAVLTPELRALVRAHDVRQPDPRLPGLYDLVGQIETLLEDSATWPRSQSCPQRRRRQATVSPAADVAGRLPPALPAPGAASPDVPGDRLGRQDC